MDHLSNYSSHFCQEHDNEPITNFCANVDCLKPLCPECIDIHNKYHHTQNTLPQISSLKIAKANCSKKVKAAISALYQEIENPLLNAIIDPNNALTEELKKMREIKEKLNEIINHHLAVLEANLKKNIEKSHANSTDVFDIYEKMKNTISELESLQKDVNTNNSLGVIKKICALDLRTLMNKFKSDLNKALIKRTSEGVSVAHDESYTEHFKDILTKLITLSKENEPQKNVVVQSFYTSPAKHVLKSSQNVENDQININQYSSNPFQNSQNPSPAYRKSNKDMFFITELDSFDSKAPKYLHFFQNDENILHILDFEDLKKRSLTNFSRIPLNIDFKIPPFHKSISLPNGDLYLIGGSLIDDPMKSKSPYIYKFNFEKSSLIQESSLVMPRSSHAVCFLGKFIYIIGGFGNKQLMLNDCEKYNITTQKSTRIASLNNACASLSVCSFFQNYLFKFGGMEMQHNLSPFIEKYIIKEDKWVVLDPKLVDVQPEKFFALLSNSCCQQINKNDILVFGGYLEDNSGSNQCFLFTFDHNVEDDDNTMIRCVNDKTLPYSEGFWNNQAIIYERQLFALQNISHDKNEDCLEDRRRILMFNGLEWRAYN